MLKQKNHISDSIRSIEGYAFDRCLKLKSINIPDSVKSIGEGAFAYCRSLKDILLPVDLKYISINVFYSCDYVTIKGYKGSYLQKYAMGNNIPFIYIDDLPANFKLGDVTGDRVIDATDASAVLTSYAESSTDGNNEMTDVQKNVYDVNCDGVVDAVDASTILTYYSMTSSKYNCTFEEFMWLDEYNDFFIVHRFDSIYD